MNRRRALIISPFATAPLDAGQRLRAAQSTRFFQELGYEITFLLYAFENPWYWKSQPDLLLAMSLQWTDVRVIYSRRQVSEPPKHGDDHHLDEWWDDELGIALQRMLAYEQFDICVVHNVWLSKALDFVPSRTIKIIDTHDVFHLRRAIFEAAGVKSEFFTVSEHDEIFGLRRADIVLTIKPQEAEVLRKLKLGNAVINLPYASTSHRTSFSDLSYRHSSKVTFGFLGTPHSFNVAGLTALFTELDAHVRRTLAPVEVLVAGSVGKAIDVSRLAFRPQFLGYVEDEAEFYRQVDIAIVPVFNGTGFKVKVAELLQLGKPMLCSTHAGEGVSFDADQVIEDAQSMAGKMVEIAFRRPSLNDLRDRVQAAQLRVLDELNQARYRIQAEIDQNRAINVFILDDAAFLGSGAAQLISFILHARSLNHSLASFIVLPASWGLDLEAMDRTSALGTQFVTPSQFKEMKREFARCDANFFVGLNPCCLTELDDGPLEIASKRLAVDLRFVELEDVTEEGLLTISSANVILLNHRQEDIFSLIPFGRSQEAICVALLTDEAFWEPSVEAVIKLLLSNYWSTHIESITLHTDDEQRVLALDASMRSSPAFMCNTDSAESVAKAFALSMKAILKGGGALQMLSATRRASWLQALIDHGTKLVGDSVRNDAFSEYIMSKGSRRDHAVAAGHSFHAVQEIFATLRSKTDVGDTIGNV